MEPLQAIFYGKIDKKNPVILSLDTEIKELKGYMKKVRSQEGRFRGARSLFNIFNKYKPRLPPMYFEEKLLEFGDFLYKLQMYDLALWQSYERYLQKFGSFNLDEITDVNSFRSVFFPEGLGVETAALTFHALQGSSICTYHLLKESDSILQNEQSINKVISILTFLRVTTEALLPIEKLCWLLYNGTLHIYVISRHLMAVGYSAKALDFLLWASMCTETSVPLLSVGYLPWRALLYTAVCQCYYDCQADLQAEVFARRSLGKISELSELHGQSASQPSPKEEKIFREATIKMAVMVFKRAVCESRRKPKGLFRPRQRSVIKDMFVIPWPRTGTERLLVEMFEGSAAQFLAVIEALWDSSRRVLQTGIHEEQEVMEVTQELLWAGTAILAGGGGSGDRVGQLMNFSQPIGGVIDSKSLLQLAVSGENGVSAEAAAKLVKLTFLYEQWDTFESLSSPMISLLMSLKDPVAQKEGQDLTLLLAVMPLLSSQKHFRGAPSQDKDRTGGQNYRSDDLFHLAETLYSVICTPVPGVKPDQDIVVDIVMLLWQKCKTVFQRMQSGAADSNWHLVKMEHYCKWVQILWLINEVISRGAIKEIDPIIVAESALRLVMELENSADGGENPTVGRDVLQNDTPEEENTTSSETSYILKKPLTEKLSAAYEILERAVDNIEKFRETATLPNATAIADTFRMKILCQTEEEKSTCVPTSFQNLIMDLHLELLYVQYRVAVKLLLLTGEGPVVECKNNHVPKFSAWTESQKSNSILTESDLLEKLKKNKICKALFLMQKAALSAKQLKGSAVQSELIEEALDLIQKAENENKKLFQLNVPRNSVNQPKSDVPPAPLLVARSRSSVIFEPAPFSPAEPVSFYRIFARPVIGVNIKLRLSDCSFPGTGEEVPVSGKCWMRVEGLQSNEMYMFAVAAYNADGKIIGGRIGEATKPMLITQSLPLLNAWAYLAQAAYQTGHFNVAKKAFQVLWDYFVISPTPNISISEEPYTYIERLKPSLSKDVLSQSSPLLLYLFWYTIFIGSDIKVHEEVLYCDAVSDNGPLIWGQVARFAECEKMLLALDLGLWLNDRNCCLQSVVQCYGLLAPLLFHKIPSISVVQILVKCLTVLQEIPAAYRQKRPILGTQNLQHMVACMTLYTAKVLQIWQVFKLGLASIELGKSLLQEQVDGPPGTTIPGQIQPYEIDIAGKQPEAERKGSGIKKTAGKAAPVSSEEMLNELLRALEANVSKDTKTVSKELTGQEDPSILYSVIYSLPPKAAYKEVSKFKKKARYLEFMTVLLQKTFSDDQMDLVLTWGQEILLMLSRRDKVLTESEREEEEERGGRASKKKTKYTAEVTEYQKKGKAPPRSATPARKKQSQADKKPPQADKKKPTPDKKAPSEKANPQAEKKKAQGKKMDKQKSDKKAMEILFTHLTPLAKLWKRRRQLRFLSAGERPWRCQINSVLGKAYFTLFSRTLEQYWDVCSDRYNMLDPRLFFLYNSGTVMEQKVVISEPLTSDTSSSMKSSGDRPEKKVKKRNVTSASVTQVKQNELEKSVDTPRTQLTNEPEPASHQSAQKSLDKSNNYEILLELLEKCVLHFRKAVTLAHRGGHWMCLQSVCHAFWERYCLSGMFLEKVNYSDVFPLMTVEHLNTLMGPTLFQAAECLLDMIVCLQENNDLQVTEPPGDFIVASCVGSILNEEGGSSLHFDPHLDNVNMVDLRWVFTLVLRCLEVLHHQSKWERLVHLAIYFNSVTHDRYTEQVTPLLIHAQRRLLERIAAMNGPEPPQPQLLKTEGGPEEQITCRSLMGTQLRVRSAMENVIDPLTGVSSAVQITYDDGKRARSLSSVPLDVMDSFNCFRESMGKAQYYSRSLRHSRKLQLLFLSHFQQGWESPRNRSTDSNLARVEFRGVASYSPTAFPSDFSMEDFNCSAAVVSHSITPTLLPVVISSYNNTIELLEANKLDSLKAQALHELGDLYMYKGNKKTALNCWRQALDMAMNQPDFLKSWEEKADNSDHSERFLHQAGIWGCLQGAFLTAKIAQYILTSNVSFQIDCCILSAMLFKALLRSSIPHPRPDWAYSNYMVGYGWDVLHLIPGVDLFSDPYRADVRRTVGCLSFVIHRLHSAGYNLMVLPLLVIQHYFVTSVCSDPQKNVENRLLKVQVLTELQFYSEAAKEFLGVLNGDMVPQLCGGFYAIRCSSPKKTLDTGCSLLDPGNLQALDDLMEKQAYPETALVYGPRLMQQLVITKTKLLVSLAATINMIPDVSLPVHSEEEQKPPSSPTSPKTLPAEPEEPRSIPLVGRLQEIIPQMDPKKDGNALMKVKGILLMESAHALTLLLQSLYTEESVNLSQLPAAELENLVMALLQLSAIQLQQGKATLSAATALSAIRLLQSSSVFETDNSPSPKIITSALKTSDSKKDQEDCDDNILPSKLPHNVEAQERLDISMWLRARLSLIQALIVHTPGVQVQPGKQNPADCAQLLKEGIAEAKASGHIELQAELLLHNVQLNLLEGNSMEDVSPLLQEAVSLLSSRRWLSFQSSLSLAKASLQLSDFKKTKSQSANCGATGLKHGLYAITQSLLQQQLLSLGENVDIREGCIVFYNQSPSLKNIFFHHIPLLAKATLRLGHALLPKAANLSIQDQLPVWRQAHQLLTSALELCRSGVIREIDVEGEILFFKGVLERTLTCVGEFKSLAALETLLEAIDVNRSHNQNLLMIRESYLEIALLLLHEDDEQTLTPGNKGKAKTPQNMLLAWFAVRAATQASEASIQCALLTGVQNEQDAPFEPPPMKSLPDFVVSDLLDSYHAYLSEENQVPLSFLLGSRVGPPEPETQDKQAEETKPAAELTWIQLIRYYKHLLKIYKSYNFSDPSCKDRVRTSMLDIGLALKIFHLHQFLTENLPLYASGCYAEDAPQELQQALSQASIFRTNEIKVKGYEERTMLQVAEKEVKSEKPINDPKTGSLVSHELCIQWYSPSLESAATMDMIVMLYAFNSSPSSASGMLSISNSNVRCGKKWIPLARLQALHKSLHTVWRKAEVFLRPSTTRPKSGVSPKKSQPSTIRNPMIQDQVKLCCAEMKALLLGLPKSSEFTKIPFELTLQTLCDLEMCFNPAGGCFLKGGCVDWILSMIS
ncbi:cilia- and flagella-associated protein 54 isoform X2 [Erpetoichthys calabaricus]|uniref:cilia- and flagella-associated protein 54 isoform X2 n=1 Tax=Erpetoichthys calabaricus TaxID=27687 RepID=UPI002234A4C7|nr:cilia- and flagella-associated protein 54 isoform X2 [Erpetoichthys calabaricus]